jgi:hypothetical protein
MKVLLPIFDLAEKPTFKVINPFDGNYKAYYSLVNSGKEQPQTTHGDRYEEKQAIYISSYVKGSIFVSIAIRYW